MKKLMKQLNAQEIPAIEVVIKTEDKDIIIKEPQVVRMKISGQESFQITGNVVEQDDEISPDDVKLVMENTGCTEEEAIDALARSKGDIAEAIMKLKK
jgi:nascent polypeptide-associated complex subunit alpha